MTCVKLLTQLEQEPGNEKGQQLLPFKHWVGNLKSKVRPLLLPGFLNDNKHLQTMVWKMQRSTSSSSSVLFKAGAFQRDLGPLLPLSYRQQPIQGAQLCACPALLSST